MHNRKKLARHQIFPFLLFFAVVPFAVIAASLRLLPLLPSLLPLSSLCWHHSCSCCRWCYHWHICCHCHCCCCCSLPFPTIYTNPWISWITAKIWWDIRYTHFNFFARAVCAVITTVTAVVVAAAITAATVIALLMPLLQLLLLMLPQMLLLLWTLLLLLQPSLCHYWYKRMDLMHNCKNWWVIRYSHFYWLF